MSPTDIKGTLTKEQYMETLGKQRIHLADRVRMAEVDLGTLDAAIVDLEHQDFDEVEVVEENGAYTFSIVEKNNE